ncbi:hypothetical protein BC829DRAFT_378571 [Chytridium lagenaria]|nr:hypothetical protein BC829DRAFT_378571 [Chytridium lagenaria]
MILSRVPPPSLTDALLPSDDDGTLRTANSFVRRRPVAFRQHYRFLHQHHHHLHHPSPPLAPASSPLPTSSSPSVLPPSCAAQAQAANSPALHKLFAAASPLSPFLGDMDSVDSDMISFILEECERFSDFEFPTPHDRHSALSRTSSLAKLSVLDFVAVSSSDVLAGPSRRGTPAPMDASMMASDMVHVEQHEVEPTYAVFGEESELVSLHPGAQWQTIDLPLGHRPTGGPAA